MTTHTATGYLILKATRATWGSREEDGLRRIQDLRISAYRANRPQRLLRDELAVKVAVTIDDAEFSPITAELALNIDPARLIKPVLEALEPELPS